MSETELSGLRMREHPRSRRAHLLQQHAAVQLNEDRLSISFGEDGGICEVPISVGRRGSELKVVQAPFGANAAAPDAVLLKLVVLASAARAAQLGGSEEPLVSHYSKAHLQQLLRISWLAPDILSAICEGRQPPTLTGRRLLRATNIPLGWVEQRKMFGFA